MKKILIRLLTIWIILLLFIFGIVLNMKVVLLNTMNQLIKKELENNIINIIKQKNLEEENQIKEELKKSFENNDSIKNIMNTYLDTIVDMINNDTKTNINIKSDIENLIETSQNILQEYGITLTEEEKNEILSVVSSNEINDLLNEEITNIKKDIPKEIKTFFKVYEILTSTTFKICIGVLLVVSLLFIGLLKKSYYKWLSNLGEASLITGLFLAILFPIGLNYIVMQLTIENAITIPIISIKNYGYAFFAFGIIEIILTIVISKIAMKKITEVKKG